MKFSPYFLLDHVVTGTKGLKNSYLTVKNLKTTIKNIRKARDSDY